ncbi:MAG: hypothetical protein M1834_002617 [Cirrosporium novae-zelandiae]|nr:MAG: hypothetical protein M1834_002617 [Cirrosporium novae-zelandiae]
MSQNLIRSTPENPIQVIPENSIHSIPNSLNVQSVGVVRIVCQNWEDVMPIAPFNLNLWSIYLLHQFGSVQFHMTLTADGLNSSLFVESSSYRIPPNTIALWDFYCRLDTTVGHFRSVILAQELDRYSMPDWRGCRWWMSIHHYKNLDRTWLDETANRNWGNDRILHQLPLLER